MRFPGMSISTLGLSALGMVLSVTAVSAQPAPAARTSAARGKIVFMRCGACHAVSDKAPGKVGPHLQGISGRASGSVTRFTYSPAMRKMKLKWDDATLDRWLQRPASVVPGTSMVFAGLPNADDRKALIAYLKKPTP